VFITIDCQLTGRSPVLTQYAVNAVTGGTAAKAGVTMRLEEGGHMSAGRGSDAVVIADSA